jgi:hypothetical protein
MTKTAAERAHAKRRFAERHFRWVTNRDLDAMADLIRQGEARFVRRSTLRVSVFDVDHDGGSFRVVYDRHRGQVVTVLPPASS